MKLLLVLLGVTAGFTASLSAQTANDSPRPVTAPEREVKARQDAAVARAARNHQCVFFITPYTATGSHIPQVVTRYEGRNYVFSSFTNRRIYSSDDIGLTGALNVGGALRALDPAISVH